MRIAFNASTLRSFGTRSVGKNLLRACAAQAKDHKMLAWIPSEWGWREEMLGPACDLRSGPSGIVAKVLRENIIMRRALRTWKADRLFSLSDTSMPACPVPHLLLVHQAFVATDPSTWDFAPTVPFRARMALIRSYFRASLPTATTITVQTEFMRSELRREWGLDDDRIAVVPSSVEPWIASLPLSLPPSCTASYVAYVASAGAHKNHVVLGPMMSALRRTHPDLRCYLTVAEQDVPSLCECATRLGVFDRFVFLGGIPAQRAIALLQGSAACVMPSKMESFGIPYYEALAVGCPLVCSDRPFAREACGDAALYADANSGIEFATRVAHLVDSSDGSEIREKARRRFLDVHWPWDRIAERYFELLETL